MDKMRVRKEHGGKKKSWRVLLGFYSFKSRFVIIIILVTLTPFTKKKIRILESYRSVCFTFVSFQKKKNNADKKYD